jgi:D(-)-tartrate dehydratase
VGCLEQGSPRALWRLLADRYNGGQADPTAWVYAAGGYYYPGKGIGELQNEMRSYLDRGYSTVKMKVGLVPLAEDLERIEAVLEVLGGDGSRLCVDVNGRFDLQEAIAFGNAIAPYGLRWYEEPVDPLDYLTHAALGTVYVPPLATGENLFSMQDARNLIRHGGLRPDRDILQFDPALSYGLVEYLRTRDMLLAHGWSPRRCVPHGGHQFALNIAVGLGLGGNESYPDVFAPFGGFADAVPVEDSRVALPQVPGIGFEAKQALYAVMRPLEQA